MIKISGGETSGKGRAERLPSRHAVRWLGSLAIIMILSGCGGAVDFSTWVVEYNRTVERAQNAMMLLNILRAGDDLPLTMSSVQVVRGNGLTTSGVNVNGMLDYTHYMTPSTAWIDSLGSSVTPGASLSVTNGFNFDVAVLDTAEFQKGFLTPIQISTINLLLQRGFPIDVLMNILVESATFTKKDGSSVTALNDPAAPSYEYFQGGLKAVLKLGLTTEPFPPFTPVGPVLSPADVKEDLDSIVEGTKNGLILMPVPGGYQLNMPSTLVRLCFMNAGPDGPDIPQSALCEKSPKRQENAAGNSPSVEKDGIRIATTGGGSLNLTFRSTRDVFTYLGHLVKIQFETGKSPILLDTLSRGSKLNMTTLPSLFHIVKDQPRPDDFVTVEYRGGIYSMPSDVGSYSASILGLLDELVKLSKSVNSIPATGTVVIH